jgi:PAT family beta-lactamase induction signal transducer AmpG
MNKRLAAFLPKKADMRLKSVLAESPASRYFSFSLLYFAQGVPEGLTFFAIPAFLAMNDVSPLVIGSYLAMAGLPWSFKLVLAPLMDRFTIKSMGRKRPWVIFGQIGLVCSFMSLSLIPNPLSHTGILMAMGFIISFFGCFQDVATDGMAVDVIPLDEQARANGLMWGAKAIGASVSLAAGTYIINRFGFSTGVLVPAVFTSLLIMVPVFFIERRGEKRLPWSRGEASLETRLLQPANFKAILRDTYLASTRYSSLFLLAVCILVGIAAGYGQTLLPIFTIQELDWSNGDYSNLFASASVVGGLLGMLIAGALVDFFGKKKMLFIYATLWMLSIGGFLFYQSMWFTSGIASLTIFAVTAMEIFTFIALFALCMAHCWKRVSATQFTLYMTVANLGRSAGSGAVGYVKEAFSWHYTFLVLLAALGLLIALVGFLRISRQRSALEKLEQKELDKMAQTMIEVDPSVKLSEVMN